MTHLKLGQLKKVSLRAVWKSEASDFTPWLAQEENLAILSDVLDIELELAAQEKNVGPFRADILCKDTATGNWVLIENQVEKTDHIHLGQLLTYASGLKAVTIIWIAANFTDEHRSALDWLNEMTHEQINFFGLEIELWQIGDSDIAPKFNVVSRPNEWTRTGDTIKHGLEAGSLSGAGQVQYEFWSAFRDFMIKNKSVVRPVKPMAQNWLNFGIGRSNIYLGTFLNTRDNRMGVYLGTGGHNSKDFYHNLYKDRAAIEQEIGHPVEWLEKPGGIESHIRLQRTDIDHSNRQKWPEYHAWMLKELEAFDRVFRPRVKQIKLMGELSAADQQ
jgi:hypothetical protein